MPIIFSKKQKEFGMRIYIRIALAYILAICPITVCTILLVKFQSFRDTPNMIMYSFLFWNQIGMVAYTTNILFALAGVHFEHFLYWGQPLSFLGREDTNTGSVVSNSVTEPLMSD
jgi:hypothetical protein